MKKQPPRGRLSAQESQPSRIARRRFSPRGAERPGRITASTNCPTAASIDRELEGLLRSEVREEPRLGHVELVRELADGEPVEPHRRGGADGPVQDRTARFLALGHGRVLARSFYFVQRRTGAKAKGGAGLEPSEEPPDLAGDVRPVGTSPRNPPWIHCEVRSSRTSRRPWRTVAQARGEVRCSHPRTSATVRAGSDLVRHRLADDRADGGGRFLRASRTSCSLRSSCCSSRS
jgi:hypothetical protein